VFLVVIIMGKPGNIRFRDLSTVVLGEGFVSKSDLGNGSSSYIVRDFAGIIKNYSINIGFFFTAESEM
jgi:hypothetical protein